MQSEFLINFHTSLKFNCLLHIEYLSRWNEENVTDYGANPMIVKR